MKNVKNLCAGVVLVLYALLAGASIDDNGDFEGWFIVLCTICPILIVFLIYYIVDSGRKNEIMIGEQKTKALSKIPSTYTLDKEGVNCAFYTDLKNKRILAASYSASTHQMIEINSVEKSSSFNCYKHYFLIDDGNQQILFVHVTGGTIQRRLIRYKEIVGFDISEDGHSIFNKSISNVVGRALVGSVLLGGFGAVVGGVTSESVEKKR